MTAQHSHTVSIEEVREQIDTLDRRIVALIAAFIDLELKHHQKVD